MSVIPSKGSKSSSANDLAINDADSLGMGDLMQDPVVDPLAGATEQKKFGTGSLVLAGVILAAFAVLWFMRSLTNVSADSTASNDLEKTIDKWIDRHKSPGQTTDPTGLMSGLNETYATHQVPLASVKGNPFLYPDQVIIDTPTTDDGAGLTRRQAERKAAFEKTAARLQLKSVIMGSTPIANISGKIVRQGDQFLTDDETAFKLVTLTAESADLEASDPDLNLVVSVTIWLRPDR